MCHFYLHKIFGSILFCNKTLKVFRPRLTRKYSRRQTICEEEVWLCVSHILPSPCAVRNPTYILADVNGGKEIHETLAKDWTEEGLKGREGPKAPPGRSLGDRPVYLKESNCERWHYLKLHSAQISSQRLPQDYLSFFQFSAGTFLALLRSKKIAATSLRSTSKAGRREINIIPCFISNVASKSTVMRMQEAEAVPRGNPIGKH